jgi:hypothetical protein
MKLIQENLLNLEEFLEKEKMFMITRNQIIQITMNGIIWL